MGKESNYEHLYEKIRIKYFFDQLFAYPLFFLLAPLILLGIWAIKVDGWFNSENKGSIFYSEPRFSAGKKFKIIKFRTVSQKTVEWIKKDLKNRSITAARPQTSAGIVILRWYLDELPQILNIIKGDMSFVGPRPHIESQHQKEIASGLIYRNFIKAGFFGVPQACKRHPRYKKLLEEMARTHEPDIKLLNSLDGLYVKKCMVGGVWSLILFDLWVVARCIVVILRGGAKF